MTTPSQFGLKLVGLTDQRNLQEVQHAIGLAAKKAVVDAVTKDLGSDMRMSNMRSKAKLTSGYDLESDGVLLHLRPKGLWMLADEGRKRSGRINPKAKRRRRKGGHRPAVRTPQGWRYNSRYRPSRGLNVVSHAMKLMEKTVPEAATKVMITKIGQL